nr:MAG TPA: hypothetical protein [Bacteriophage sp.]
MITCHSLIEKILREYSMMPQTLLLNLIIRRKCLLNYRLIHLR